MLCSISPWEKKNKHLGVENSTEKEERDKPDVWKMEPDMPDILSDMLDGDSHINCIFFF